MLLILIALTGWVLFALSAYVNLVQRKVSRDIYERQARAIRHWQDRAALPTSYPLPGVGRIFRKEDN